jgi:hypothetical chaperone protein
MNTPLAYAVDFGTTNSLAAAVYRDRVDLIDVEATRTTPISPSIVYLHRDGNRAAGLDAIAQYLVTGADTVSCGLCPLVSVDDEGWFSDCHQFVDRTGRCNDSRLLSGLKSDLGDESFISTHSWAIDFTKPELVAVVLRRLKLAADRELGLSTTAVTRVVVGHPVAFAGTEGPDFVTRQAHALEQLERAAELAGFTEIYFLEEPAAALYDDPVGDGITVAVDLGGGTFDVAVLELRDGTGDVSGLQGAAIGGELFDKLLFDGKIAPELGLDRDFRDAVGRMWQLPPRLRDDLSSMAGVKRVLSDPTARRQLEKFRAYDGGSVLSTIETIVFGGHGYQFFKAVENAKIELSSSTEVTLEFHRLGVDVSIPIRRSEFEKLIADQLSVVENRILAAIQQAGVAGDDVDFVLRTGGSSTIPAFVELVQRLFPNARITQRPPFTTIVSGLGAFAQEIWS